MRCKRGKLRPLGEPTAGNIASQAPDGSGHHCKCSAVRVLLAAYHEHALII